jgi:hypothetical protein
MKIPLRKVKKASISGIIFIKAVWYLKKMAGADYS